MFNKVLTYLLTYFSLTVREQKRLSAHTVFMARPTTSRLGNTQVNQIRCKKKCKTMLNATRNTECLRGAIFDGH